jgi:hypothetical protein
VRPGPLAPAPSTSEGPPPSARSTAGLSRAAPFAKWTRRAIACASLKQSGRQVDAVSCARPNSAFAVPTVGPVRCIPVPMRTAPTILLCLAAAACSSLPPPEAEPPPNDIQLKVGITQAITDAHFAKPVEVTELVSAPASSTQPWMICIRSAVADESGRRLTYAAFFGRDGSGKFGQYARSRYSTSAENCETQAYHPFIDSGPPAPVPSPSPTPEPKKRHSHRQ